MTNMSVVTKIAAMLRLVELACLAKNVSNLNRNRQFITNFSFQIELV